MQKLILPIAVLFLFSGCVVSEKKYKMKEEKLALVTEERDQLLIDKDELEEQIEILSNDAQNLFDSLESTQNDKNKLITELTKTKNNLNAKVAAFQREARKLKLEKERALASMKKSYNNLVNKMQSEIKQGEIKITQLKNKLTVNMVDKVLFRSGEAEVLQKGELTLAKVGTVLKDITDKQIRIEGHTDNVPISKDFQAKFPTNWELSTARATNVARYLIENAGINPKLVSVAGYADTRPVSSNNKPEGRAKNRRIEIVLIPLDK
ncbi:OmpA family protein [Elusimicrobiota bacterium]